MSRLARILAAIGLAWTLSVQAAPIVIKFSHVVAPDTPKGKAAERFNETRSTAQEREIGEPNAADDRTPSRLTSHLL